MSSKRVGPRLDGVAMNNPQGLLGTKGVTLVELMVVLAIIAVSAALTAPYFAENLKQVRLKGAARSLASDLLWARSQAVDRMMNYWIHFNSINNEYTICRDVSCDTGGKVEKKVNIAIDYSRVKFGYGSGVLGPPESPSGMPSSAVTFSNKNITFDYLGRSMNGDNPEAGEIYLLHEETQKTYAITVQGGSGSVKLYRWREGQWK